MSLNPIRSGQGRRSPFAKPFLHALTRMQERETLRPDQLTEQARMLLDEAFGVSARPVETAFAYGGTGLMSEHTHYFDGFALLMSLPLGTAVAVRQADAAASQVTFEDSLERRTFDVENLPRDGTPAAPPAIWACLVAEAVRRLKPPDSQVEVAVVSTVLPCCTEAYLAALAAAATRALQQLFARTEERTALLRGLFDTCLNAPFSMAYGLGADVGAPGAFTLVDTGTQEHLPVEAPAPDGLGWGLVDTKVGPLHEAAFYRQQQARADRALALLQQRGFGQLTSLRELEHRSLQRALDVLPRSFRPLVRHLVTENQRVQKLVAAVRRRDWQMFGALFLMSHASQRSDGGGTPPEVDLVVEQVEAMSIDGMYGARMSGHSGCVLILGQPFVVPACLDRIQAALEARFGVTPETMLL